MSKHRKTLKEKQIADLRHKFYSFDQAKLGFDSKNISSLKTNNDQETKEVKNVSTTISLTNKYPYLISDISKTGILTGIIVLAQIILYFLLKNHILKIPGIIY